ncbi:condensin-2 complex subunit H2-like isoform X2 [Watersipora subatra]|uniref:condensin-2 complex subunit H2-like isoform X2 n=1 Tax=Watersipora subatra TaxID=2589382 RepID=UPI00355BA1B3
MEELVEQCQLLLVPIRNLEQNWSVDLANELTQAILCLNDQMVSIGGMGEKMIDFSKAAMIIQGSAQVYSKKVDYLYKSVLEMKDWMEKLWEAERRKNRTKDTGSKDLELNAEEEDEDDILDLSDVDEDQTVIDETCALDEIEGNVILPPRPSSLADRFHLKIPIISPTGDVIGFMDDFLINSIDIEALLQSRPTQASNEEIRPGSVSAIAEVSVEGDIDLLNEDSFHDVSNIQQQVSPAPAVPMSPSHTPMRVDRQVRVLRARCAEPAHRPQIEQPVDPWTRLLDNNSSLVTRPSRKLKPGNCRVLPQSLRKGKKRKPDGSYPTTRYNDDVSTFYNRDHSALPNASHLIFPEFKLLFFDKLKELQEVFKTQRQKRFPYADDDDIIDVADDFNDDCDDGMNNYDDENIPISRLQDMTARADKDSASADLPAGYSEFLAKVLKKQYQDTAVQIDKLSEIDKRVKAWEANVQGALDIVEMRPSFNMLNYSNQILSSFTEERSSIPMNALLEGKEKYEAYRTFLSTLILANHGNVDIFTDKNQVNIQLLNKLTLSDVIAAEGVTGTTEPSVHSHIGVST